MPAANPPAQLYNKALVGWLSVAQLIGWGSVFYLFAQVMAPVEQALQVGRAQTSLAFSLCLLMDGLLAYPVGRLIDRGHERLVMTLGSLTLAAGLALHSQVNNLWAFYAVWMLLGTGMAATLYAPVFAVVTRRFPHDFRRAIITMTFLGGPGQHGVYPAHGLADHAAGLAALPAGFGRAEPAGVCPVALEMA